MTEPRIVILAGRGISTNILFNSIKEEFAIKAIILEEGVSKKMLLQRRLRKLGLFKVLGQIMFQLIIVKILNILSAKRKRQILHSYNLQNDPLPEKLVIPVKSVNDVNCLLALKKLDPSLVIVNGTRIISKHILISIPAKFINMHAGITPMYRGVHGAYWALANNDSKHCGVTIHLVDEGIDTGAIIAQLLIQVRQEDNFVTYPLLQLAEGMPLMKTAIRDTIQDQLITYKCPGESRLWFHPGLFQYLYYRVVKKIK